MDKNSKISVDDLKELARTGAISWEDAITIVIEKELQVNLNRLQVHFDSMAAFRIDDPTVKGSDSLTLYIRFDTSDTGEPIGFCFRSANSMTIPLSIHTADERNQIRIGGYRRMLYFTPMSKLNREAYLSAAASPLNVPNEK